MEQTFNFKLVYNLLNISISTFLVYLGLDKEAFMMFAVLLVIDYITGITKAFQLKISITSNRMKYGIISKLSLITIPIMLAVGSKALNIDITNLVYLSINMLVISEMYSIVGNVYSIRTRKELPEYDVLAIIGKRIRNILIEKG